MKISCIIPNFNDERIARSISSFVKQKYKNKELIVVDACSDKPEVLNIYNKYATEIDKLIVEKDRGIFDGLNKGIRHASGDVICLMGSDDFYPYEDIFCRVAEKLRDGGDGLCIGARFCDENGKIVRSWIPSSVSSKKILWGLLPPHFSLFLTRQVYNSVGEFDINIPISSDSDWILRMGLLEDLQIIVDVERHLVMQAGGVSNASLSNVLAANRDVMRTWRRHGMKNWFFAPIIKVVSKVRQVL